jgi:hypothetical protein
MKIYYFIFCSLLTFSLSSIEPKNIVQGKDNNFNLTSGITSYFTVYIDWDDSVDIKIKMSRDYKGSNLKLYYCLHNSKTIYESDLTFKKSLDFSETYSSTQTILNSEIDNSFVYNYLTLIITSNTNLDIIIYAKGKNETSENIKKIIYMAIFIPIGIILLIITICIICICCCSCCNKPKKVVYVGSPQYAPVQPLPPPQPLYAQPIAVQPLYPQQPPIQNNYQQNQAY